MGLINIKHYIRVFLFQVDQGFYIAAVAIHAVDRLHDHKNALIFLSMSLNQTLKMCEIIMTETCESGVRQHDTVNDGGMYEFVSQNLTRAG